MSPFLVFLALQTPNPYVRLGAAIPKREWEAVVADLARSDAKTSPLAVRRAAAERWGSVLTGLRKATDEPYASGPLAIEDAPAVERLTAFAVTAAYVRFADGDRTGGTTILLDVLRMARRTSSAPAEEIVFGAFAERLSDLPLTQCDRVRADVDAYLNGTLVLAPRTETRLRLLRLHMRVEAYRWRYLRLPTKLLDAAPPAEAEKPASHRPFRYETRGAGYRLAAPDGTTLAPPTRP